MTIESALLKLRPGAQWSCYGGTYDGLVWQDQAQSQPTREEVEAMMSQPDPLVQFNAAIAAGYTVDPEGFTLAIGESDRLQFTQLLALVREALDLGAITGSTPQQIKDASGTLHTVTTDRLRQILVGYGFHYKQLWDALNS